MSKADPLMISVSGVRGIIGSTLTPQVAVEFGQAFGHFLLSQGKGERREGKASSLSPLPSTLSPTVVIGRDTRPSGPMVFGAVAAGLMSVGVNVVDVGIATTPSVPLLGRFLKAQAGIVITASHNPILWNGIKFLREDGVAFPPASAAEIKRIYFEKPWKLVPIETLGRLTEDSRAHAHHVQTVLQYFDVKAIGQKRFKVVLDSVNGAGGLPTPILLGKLSAEMVHMNAAPTGIFAHIPEPTKENLVTLCEEVKRRKAAVGFAQDPDADRLAIVDENGTYIGEEYTLALGAYARMLINPVSVVTNLSTSRMVDDIAAKFGQVVYRTPVGEANVAGKMMEIAMFGDSSSFFKGKMWGAGTALNGGVIGGEGNGGIIDLRIGPVRDSLYGIVAILDLMTHTGKSLSELVAEIPAYSMLKTKFECTPEQSAALVAKVKQKFADQKLDTQDGVRIDWPEGWVHVRQSNTEPIARVIAEAKDEATAKKLVEQVQSLR